jgi:hypothetical protein
MSTSDATPIGRATPPPYSFDVFALNVNLIALIAALMFTFVGIKLTSFLPSKYYFSFSKLVDSHKHLEIPFLITTPAYLNEDKLCEILNGTKELQHLKCETAQQSGGAQKDGEPGGAQQEPNIDDATYMKEVQIADRVIRQAAQSEDSLSNLTGLAIRLCVPLLVGFVIGRSFAQPGELAASVGAAAAALLLCWPVIVFWDLVVTEGFKELYAQFLLLYVLYTVTFFYMARIGAIFGVQMRNRGSIFSINVSKIIESAVIAIIGGVGARFVESLILKP